MIFTRTNDVFGFISRKRFVSGHRLMPVQRSVSRQGSVSQEGFVSGHRFSDAASPSKPTPLGAATTTIEAQQ